MVERRFRRRQLLLLAIPVAALAFLVSVRLLDPEDPCPEPSAAPSSQMALMPAGLSFDQVGTVTNVRRWDDNHVTVKAFTTKTLDESTVLIQEAVTAAGYRFTGMDSEGNEAEVFFNSGSVAAGLALVRQSACAGRWDIDLTLLDRAR
jgi:hypothetical protein